MLSSNILQKNKILMYILNLLPNNRNNNFSIFKYKMSLMSGLIQLMTRWYPRQSNSYPCWIYQLVSGFSCWNINAAIIIIFNSSKQDLPMDQNLAQQTAMWTRKKSEWCRSNWKWSTIEYVMLPWFNLEIQWAKLARSIVKDCRVV